ncbi:hypothetical protein C4573_05870 [Candidatus Woesearchaeota archaeon]|nr:MAG: hypothetical protein C4573_05870 [Candidatus Woesearchaeota archaeon]
MTRDQEFLKHWSAKLSRTASAYFKCAEKDRVRAMLRDIISLETRVVGRRIRSWKNGHAIWPYTKEEYYPSNLNMLSLFLYAIKVPETDPAIAELKSKYSFSYPPDEETRAIIDGYKIKPKEKPVLLLKSETLKQTVAAYLSTMRDVQQFYSRLADVFGIKIPAVYTQVHNWRNGRTFGVSSANPQIPEIQLDRTSLFLYGLKVPETHPVIAELRQMPMFIYPPPHASDREKLDKPYTPTDPRAALIERIKLVPDETVATLTDSLDSLVAKNI